MSQVVEKSNLKRLDNHIGKNGHFQWKNCLNIFKQFLNQNGDTICDAVDKHLYCTFNFELDGEDGNQKLKYVALEEESRPRPAEAYLSPDHILEADLDQRSQVYSLGCVLYECLSGEPPYSSKKVKTLVEQQISFDPRSLLAHTKKDEAPLPEPVIALVMKALAKNPKDRFQSFEELEEALSETVKSLEMTKNEPKTADQLKDSEKADPRPLIVSASIMLALTLMIVGTITYVSSESFKSHLYMTRNKNKNLYLLSLEDSNYKMQMDFKDAKPVPEAGAVPITLVQKETKKIVFATTQKKTVKAALEEARRRGLLLYGLNLRKADLAGIDLSGSRLMQADFTEANLKGANLSGCELTRASFHFANLESANLDKARLSFSDFRRCNLENASMKGAFAAKSNFERAFLKNTDLSDATIAGALFEGANLEGAKMDRAMAVNIDWSKSNLTKEQLNSTLEAKQLQVQKRLKPEK